MKKTSMLVVVFLVLMAMLSVPFSTAFATTGQEIADYAALPQFQGIPYVFCGESLKGIDCSGFTKMVYAAFDIELPHYTGDQRHLGTAVESKSDLLPGDLVFFRSYRHVGIYIGNGEFVHASSGKGYVLTSTLESGYYADHYSGARRLV